MESVVTRGNETTIVKVVIYLYFLNKKKINYYIRNDIPYSLINTKCVSACLAKVSPRHMRTPISRRYARANVEGSIYVAGKIMPHGRSKQDRLSKVDETLHVEAANELRLQDGLQAYSLTRKHVLGKLNHEDGQHKVNFRFIGQLLKLHAESVDAKLLRAPNGVQRMDGSFFSFGNLDRVGDHPRIHGEPVSIQYRPANILGQNGIVVGFSQRCRKQVQMLLQQAAIVWHAEALNVYVIVHDPGPARADSRQAKIVFHISLAANTSHLKKLKYN